MMKNRTQVTCKVRTKITNDKLMHIMIFLDTGIKNSMKYFVIIAQSFLFSVYTSVQMHVN